MRRSRVATLVATVFSMAFVAVSPPHVGAAEAVTTTAKLDLVLMVDLSGSYSDDLETLRTKANEIFDQVRAEAPNSRLALASFVDYPFTPWGEAASDDYAYSLDLDFTTNRTAWRNAINALAVRFGDDGPESQYEALYQVATGAGRNLPGTSLGDVPPGLAPSFRADAQRVVAITTDADFHVRSDSTCSSPSPCPFAYPGPSRDDAISALQAARVRVIAIKAPGSGDEMDDLAAQTNGSVQTTDAESTQITSAILEGIEDLNASFNPAVASSGAVSIAVWEDYRNGAADIYGARINAAGTVLDPGGFPISVAAGDQTNPAIAYGQGLFWVVWQDRRNGNSDIYGTRVSTAGAVQTPAGTPISRAGGEQVLPAIDDSMPDFLVVWADGRNGAQFDIYGARLNSSGNVLNPSGISISRAAGRQFAPAVNAGPGDFWYVAWQDRRSGQPDIYGTRVSHAGAVSVASGTRISSVAGNQYEPAITSDGNNAWFVVWADDRRAFEEFDVFGTRLNANGQVLTPNGTALTTATDDQFDPTVSWNGATYFAAWGDVRSGTPNIRGTRVSSSGTVLNPGSILVSGAPGVQQTPSTTNVGSSYAVVWSDERTGQAEIFGTRLSGTGVVQNSSGFPIT